MRTKIVSETAMMMRLAATPSRRSKARRRVTAPIRRPTKVSAAWRWRFDQPSSKRASFLGLRHAFFPLTPPPMGYALEAQAALRRQPTAIRCLVFQDRKAAIPRPERLEAVLTVGRGLFPVFTAPAESIELVAMSRLCSAQGKVERLVAGEAMRAGKFDRRLTHIRGTMPFTPCASTR